MQKGRKLEEKRKLKHQIVVHFVEVSGSKNMGNQEKGLQEKFARIVERHFLSELTLWNKTHAYQIQNLQLYMWGL